MTVDSWDLDKFLSGLGHMQSMAPKLLQLFVHGTQSKVAYLQTALQDNNIEAIAQLVHSIKGTASQVQCVTLAHIAVEIEHTISAGHAELIEAQCQRLITQALLDIQQIQTYLNSVETTLNSKAP